MKKLTIILVMLIALTTQSFKNSSETTTNYSASGSEIYYIWGYVSDNAAISSNPRCYVTEIYTINVSNENMIGEAEMDFVHALENYSKNSLQFKTPSVRVGRRLKDYKLVQESRDGTLIQWANATGSSWVTIKIDKNSFPFSYNK